jgi:hypothetical protein
MPKSITLTHEDVERVRDTLAKAPEKPKVPSLLTVREMIVSIKAEIQDLVKRRYTFEEIAEMIRSGSNLEQLRASTLKQYLHKKRSTSKTTKTPSTTAEASSPFPDLHCTVPDAAKPLETPLLERVPERAVGQKKSPSSQMNSPILSKPGKRSASLPKSQAR